jgi:capsular exopolysaccharide synthesis family protein
LRSSLIGIPENEKPIDFAQTYSFGSKVQHPDFQFVIDKIGVMDNSEYSFTVVPNDKMYQFIQQSLTAVSIVKSDLVSLQGNIIEISYKDTVAQRSEEILNSLAEAYIDRSISIKELVAKQKLKFIDEQLASINASLNKSSGNIKNYKTEHVFVNLDDKARLSSMKLDQLESKLSELDMQESVLTNLLSYLNNNKDISGIDVGATDIATSPILSLIEKIQTVNTQYASLLTQYTEKHPSVIQVQKQLTSLRASLRETLESSLRGINQRKSTLREIIKVNKESLEGMPEQEEQLSELTRSFMVNNKVFEYLLEKRIEAAIAKSSTISSARIIDNANADQKPIEPNRILMIIVGLFLGIIIGILQAVVRNYFENTIQSISDLEKRTFVPLYATLPIFSTKKSLYEDSLRMLLTKLEYMEARPKVVTITSSVQGEGKTSTAIEFASIMASSGKKVILLEMDIRGSGINKRLKINGQGLESYLNGSVTLKDIKHSIAKNMDVIISDVTPSTSYSVIISEQFESLLVNLRSEYDYIILESPPAGIVVDALALMRLSDLCFIVFKAYYSKKDFINNMNRFVQEYGLSNIGLILNGLELGKIRPWYKK